MMLSKTRGIGMTSQRTRDRMIARLREQGIRDEPVLAAMGAVPRHIFIEEALASRAYEDTALPIGFEQTISQPFVVALMLSALRAEKPMKKVLEVGTGCGYQAALLARLAAGVYSVERIAELLERARRNLRPLRLSNLRLVHGDGARGLPEAAPFDGIIVAAAAPRIPEMLVQQLAPGGRMIVPVGSGDQVLCLIERTPAGLTEKWLDAVRFVPLRGGKQ
ncbi:MAG TPA: protein-L-isoaspartate(D-aspartate) O-methyltransferase [Burkholderiales bacterium]|jgi:protein-L-isoaspartate(D-aspartate) O-methyltransferase|nr:protein-L-isoaspartate(D-aspartate) O-methyltransferase [Burkholderiales bacterium]